LPFPRSRYTLEEVTRDQIRADVRRALEAAFSPDDADERMRALERRLDSGAREVTGDTLLVEIADAVRAAFPDRGDELLQKLQRLMESRDVRGDVTVVEPRTMMAAVTDPRIRLDEVVPSLVVLAPLGHPLFGRSFLLDRRKVLAGRAAGCELVLDESSVSRRHFEVDLSHETDVRVTDLKSLNGTFVNGTRLEAMADVALNPRDSLACGRLVMKFFDPRRAPVRRLAVSEP
jgi:hypothetical protein